MEQDNRWGAPGAAAQGRGVPWRENLAAVAAGTMVVTVFFSIALQQAAAALGWLSRLTAPGRGARPDMKTGPRAWLWGPLVAFLGLSALSALFGVAPRQGVRVLRAELLAVGHLLAGAALARQSQVRVVLAAFFVTAAVAGAWSIYQVIFEFGGVFDYTHRAYGFWRQDAFVQYGNVLSMTFALVVGLWLWGFRRLQWVRLGAAAFAIVGMIASYTRASWIASAAILAAASAWRRALVPLVSLAFIAGLVLIVPARDDTKELAARMRSSFDLTASTNIDRIVRYQVGADVIRDYPIWGTGPGGLVVVYPGYARPGAMENSHLHNTYLQILAERGPLALAAWLVLVVGGVVRAFRLAGTLDDERRAVAAGAGWLLVAVLLVGIFNYVWSDWRVRSLALLFLGLVWSPGLAPEGDDRRRVAGPGPGPSP